MNIADIREEEEIKAEINANKEMDTSSSDDEIFNDDNEEDALDFNFLDYCEKRRSGNQ
jgi:hypothetical protein